MRSRGILFAGLSLVLSAGQISATTYLVRPDGTGDFPTLQTAIDAVTDGDVIELADGIFTGDGNRDVMVTGKAITIRSAGGDPTRCTIDCEGSPSEHHRGFRVFEGLDKSLSISGMTIRNAYVSGDLYSGSGAAICFEYWYPEPEVTHCVFIGNRATWGGAIHAHGDAFVEIRDCAFQDNAATTRGAAVTAGPLGGVTMQRCLVVSGEGGGGAGTASLYSTLILENCTVAFNAGGGILGSEGGWTRVENTIVAFNDGPSFSDDPLFDAVLICCNLYGNAGGNWTPASVTGQNGINGNFSADPLFCDSDAGDFHLRSDSPCTPGSNPECGLIGALPVGCDEPTDVRTVTWGRVKALYH